MTIDVSDIIKTGSIKRTVEGNVTLGQIEYRGNTFKFFEPLKVEGTISNNDTTIILDADVHTEFITECARCMEDAAANMDFHIEESFIRDDDEENADEDVRTYSGHSLEIDAIIAENFLMNVETGYLCRPDCKGLCPNCGKNLNEGECNCADSQIDPRWAGLLDIMNNSAEE